RGSDRSRAPTENQQGHSPNTGPTDRTTARRFARTVEGLSGEIASSPNRLELPRTNRHRSDKHGLPAPHFAPGSVDPGYDATSSPTTDKRATTVPRRQLV